MCHIASWLLGIELRQTKRNEHYAAWATRSGFYRLASLACMLPFNPFDQKAANLPDSYLGSKCVGRWKLFEFLVFFLNHRISHHTILERRPFLVEIPTPGTIVAYLAGQRYKEESSMTNSTNLSC